MIFWRRKPGPLAAVKRIAGVYKGTNVRMSFDLLEHPADIGFRVRGATLEELFANGAYALLSIVLDPSDIRPIQSISISATCADRESLLVNWLNEVLYHVDGRRMAFEAFDVARVDETHLECVARGEPCDRNPVPVEFWSGEERFESMSKRSESASL